MKVLIIEDEPMIAFQLKEIIESLGHKMVARAPTRDAAIEKAREHKPGLILVDIQLADGSSGLDAMDMISEFHQAPCIVITAYPERLLAGRANEPAFLISKPFRAEHVKTVISQALLAAKAGATFISPFIGRLDDINLDGMELIADIRRIYDNYGFDTEILAASIRTMNHVREAALIGADVATVPPSTLKGLIKHPLTDKGLETFLADWKATGQTIG